MEDNYEENELQTLVSFKDFPLNLFNYGRPNFLQYVEHMLPKKENMFLKYDPPFPQWLFATVRGILDSKYHEFVLYEDMGFSNISRMAEFSYSWLGKFCIDRESRQIRALDFAE